MEMLGHQHPSKQAEAVLPAKLRESPDKIGAETVGIKQASTSVNAGGDEMQVVRSVVMSLSRHAGMLQPGIAHIARIAMYAPPVKTINSFK